MPAIQTLMTKRMARHNRERLRKTYTNPKPKKEKREKPTPLLRVDDLLEHDLHPGQMAAWVSEARFVCIIAGTQGGKTWFGPYWLLREIQQCGAGDYWAVAPRKKLMKSKLLPELKRLLVTQSGLFVYNSSDQIFELTGEGEIRLFGTLQEIPTRVLLMHAESESLESATIKAALLDECGQRTFKLSSWQAIERRLLQSGGRVLITTTPYNLGWLKSQIWDPWKAAPAKEAISGSFVDSEGALRSFSMEQHDHDEIACYRFETIMNSSIPVQSVESARRRLPAWKFDMFYRGLFTRPAGLIYDCFDEAKHKVSRFVIPQAWPRYMGIDFGSVNCAAVFIAVDPETSKLYVYRDYHAGNRSSAQHVEALYKLEPRITDARGGSHQEQGWRDAFYGAGLYVDEPQIRGVEVGIDAVYAAIQNDLFYVFDDLESYLEELLTYSRELDDSDKPTEKIANKAQFHRLDATRYILPTAVNNDTEDADVILL